MRSREFHDARPTPPISGVVAIVGRPNVGKSTLFNRLAGRRQSIVHDQPGVTRDRLHGIARLDDDHAVQLIDTGGLVPGDDPIGINRQVLAAVEESDLLLFVVDGAAGLTSADEEVWSALRRSGRRTLLLVNKADVGAARQAVGEFHALGIDPVLLISAEHGEGIGDVRAVVLGHFQATGALAGESNPADDATAVDPARAGAPAIAIVGRPNVGKSSLLNRLLGVERAIVSPVAGTTRDPIDTWLERDGRHYRLIDTAGIRRRSKVSGAAEDLAVMFARRQAERSDVVALVVDAEAGITAGDLAIAGMLWELGKGAVVVVNKWDLLDDRRREELDFSYPRLEEILAKPNRVNVSAVSGRGVEKLLPALDATLVAQRTEITTGELNRFLEGAIRRHKAPADQGRPWKMYYATQVSTAPPTFMIFANRALPPQHSYRRYLENSLRDALGLAGVPIRLVVRRRTEG
jgi:GTP-binding protein